MRRSNLCLLLMTLMLAATVQQVSAYPRPARGTARPEVTFQPGPLRMFVDADGTRYWYLVYDVVNTSGEDRTWAPSSVLYTDKGEIRRDGEGVSHQARKAIMDHVGDPLIEPKVAIIGVLRQGTGHARRGMLVWPAGTKHVNELRIFVEGISPETAIVPHPGTGDPVTLRKNLYLHYLVGGEAAARGDQAIDLHPSYTAEEHWIFR